MGQLDRKWSFGMAIPSHATEELIVEYWQQGGWNVYKLSQALPLEVVGRVLSSNFYLDNTGRDLMFWKESVRGVFQVSLVIKLLNAIHVSSWFFKCIWLNGVPIKMSFHLWWVVLNKLPIHTNLYWFNIQGPLWCYCCTDRQSETLQHVFAFGSFPR